MEIICPKIGIWIMIIIQSFLIHWMESSPILKSIDSSNDFKHKQNINNNESKKIFENYKNKRTETEKDDHNILVIDVSNLDPENPEISNDKPKLLPIDISILSNSKPLKSSRNNDELHKLFLNKNDNQPIKEFLGNVEKNNILSFPQNILPVYHPDFANMFSDEISFQTNTVPLIFSSRNNNVADLFTSREIEHKPLSFSSNMALLSFDRELSPEQEEKFPIFFSILKASSKKKNLSKALKNLQYNRTSFKK